MSKEIFLTASLAQIDTRVVELQAMERNSSHLNMLRGHVRTLLEPLCLTGDQGNEVLQYIQSIHPNWVVQIMRGWQSELPD